MNFADKKVLVLGLGESGLAMARWLARCGAIVRVADTRETPERLTQLQNFIPTSEFIGGAFQVALLDGVDHIVVSPGLSPLTDLAEIIAHAAEHQLTILGEVELFALALNSLKDSANYTPKIIAITGTNGKTTVTSLTGQLCARAGLTVKVAGNISPSMLDVLMTCLDEENLPQVWVLELSSFQLHTNTSLVADVATVLNVTQDHLDWHGDIKNYCADKAKIFSASTLQVLNREDALVMSMKKTSAGDQELSVTFGSDAPSENGDFGLVNDQGMTWLATATVYEEEQTSTRKRKKEQQEAEVIVSRLMPVDALQIRGQHNACNALAALALCRGIGLPLAPLLHGLREYKGEPHRVEFVAKIQDVSYFDDSKGTNVGATVAALKGLGEENPGTEKHIILIAGGDGKGQDFSPLSRVMAKYVKTVHLIGKDADAIASAIENTSLAVVKHASLEAAVQAASAQAQAGDIVLLSPACASLDMFKNYAHRAQVFVDTVREIALDKGEIC